MTEVLESPPMGRPKTNDEPQTQIRITRRAYEAVRKAAEIRKMTPPAYVSLVALQAAEADILEDAKKTIAEAEARIGGAKPSQKSQAPKR